MSVFATIGNRVIMMPQRQFLVALFFLALIVRLLFVIWNPIQDSNDLYEHGDVAHHIYAGNGFTMHWPYPTFDTVRQAEVRRAPTHEGAFLPPVNPYVLASFYKIFGENTTATTQYTLFMCLVGAFIPLVTYRLTKCFASEGTARLAALLSACNVFAAFGVSTYTGSTLYQLLGVAFLYSLFRAHKRQSLASYALVGLLAASMILLRSEFVLISFVLILLSALLFEGRATVKLRYVSVAVVVQIALVAPWVYRNYQLFDAFVPVLSHPWYEVWRGNNPVANGTRMDNGTPIWVDTVHHAPIVRAMDQLPYDAHFEVRADSIFREEVLAFWQQDPMHALGLGLKKVALFTMSDFNRSTLVNTVYALASSVLFWMTVLGIVTLLRVRAVGYARIAGVLGATFLAYYLVLTFFTIMLPRYQIYVLNTMLPFAAVGMGAVATYFAKRGEHNASPA